MMKVPARIDATSFEQLLTAHPQLALDDLRACLEYAAALAADEVVLTQE
jgi:uncharacterized protein (DUF433 family)